MRNESYVVKKEPCPRCRSEGHDRKGDNLAVYSDGHSYCYRCGFVSGGNRSFHSNHLPARTENLFAIPEDADPVLPLGAAKWLEKYNITFNDRVKHRILWSNKYKWLIFSVFNDKELLGFQARNFDSSKPYKWFSKLDKSNPFVLKADSPTLIVVEDIVSAIACNKAGFNSLPLFGSFVSKKYMMELRVYPDCRIWLDRDKAKDAVLYAQTAKGYGIGCRTIITKLDPKDYSTTQIMEFVNDTRSSYPKGISG